MSEAEQGAKGTPRQILRVVFRRWRVFLMVASLVAVGALVYFEYFKRPQYTGEARFERELFMGGASDRGSQEEINVMRQGFRQELTAFRFVEQIAEKLGLTRSLPRTPHGELTDEGERAKQQLVTQLREKISVAPEMTTTTRDLWVVRFTHSDPVLAQAFPNALVKEHLERKSQEIVTELEEKRVYLEQQVKAFLGPLNETKSERMKLEEENILGGDVTAATLQQSVERLEADISALTLQRKEAEELVQDLSVRIKTYEAMTDEDQVEKIKRTVPNPEINRIKGEVRQVENAIEEQRLFLHRTPEHDMVKTLNTKLAMLQEELEETPPTIEVEETVVRKAEEMRAIVEDLRSRLSASEIRARNVAAESERLAKRREKLVTQIASWNAVRRQYEDLLQKQGMYADRVERYRQQLTAIQIQQAAEAANKRTRLNAVQLAAKQWKPSQPTFNKVLLLALGGGLAAGFGLVWLGHLMDRTITTSEQAVRQFGMPVFGVIGEIVTPRERAWRRLKKTFSVCLMITLLGMVGLFINSLWLHLDGKATHEQWPQDPAGAGCKWLRETFQEAVREAESVVQD
jgi:uncharacterized protein involved in exopolysaccharide biosynthesis